MKKWEKMGMTESEYIKREVMNELAFQAEQEKYAKEVEQRFRERVKKEGDKELDQHYSMKIWNDLIFKEYTTEKEFTKGFLVKFFRDLGYSNVRYTHGKKEYGRDIILEESDTLGNVRYLGVQVKLGNISGGARGDIDEIISQINDGFTMDFPNLEKKGRSTISGFIIVTNSKFTENATDKIIQKLSDHSIKNNVSFLDREGILNKLHSLLKNREDE